MEDYEGPVYAKEILPRIPVIFACWRDLFTHRHHLAIVSTAKLLFITPLCLKTVNDLR
jgi:hypothetical protein